MIFQQPGTYSHTLFLVLDQCRSRPTLVNDLMAIITTNLQARYSSPTEDPRSTLTLRRTLKLLNSVIKEFASMKMLSGVKIMAQVRSYV